MLVAGGCSDDDFVDIPVEEAVEAGLDSALTSTVVPLAQFLGTVGQLLTPPIQSATAGLACPSTTGWCSVGSVTCTPGVNGLDFDFDECLVVAGDEPLNLDGNVTAVPGSPILLTLTNLFINNGSALSGTSSIDVVGCAYGFNVTSSDAGLSGTIVQCEGVDEYPTGNTVLISFDDFLVTVVLDGTSTATATATQDGTPVAFCTINLDADPLASSCSD